MEPLPQAAAEEPPPTLIRSSRSAHHEIFVYQSGTSRYMTFRPEAAAPRQARIDVTDPQRVVAGYTQAFVAATAMHGQPKRVLVLGVGGGILPSAVREAFPQATIDAVDIDEEVIAIARELFGLSCGDDGRLHLHAADARNFVREAHARGDRWDVVMHDVFDSEYVPAHMMTTEFFGEICAVLEEGGLVAINSHAQGELHTLELATIAASFANFFWISVGAQNRVIVAYPTSRPEDAVVFTNLSRHKEALRRVGVDASAIAGQVWEPRTPPDAALALTDESSRSSRLATLRRAVLGNLGGLPSGR